MVLSQGTPEVTWKGRYSTLHAPKCIHAINNSLKDNLQGHSDWIGSRHLLYWWCQHVACFFDWLVRLVTVVIRFALRSFLSSSCFFVTLHASWNERNCSWRQFCGIRNYSFSPPFSSSPFSGLENEQLYFHHLRSEVRARPIKRSNAATTGHSQVAI
jgi:hypothetical protein